MNHSFDLNSIACMVQELFGFFIFTELLIKAHSICNSKALIDIKVKLWSRI